MKNVKAGKWYYNRNLKPQGPVSESELRQMISRGEIGPHDLICSDVDDSWRPAAEWGVFEMSLFPAAQKFLPGVAVSQEEKEWVLLVPSSEAAGLVQEGPYCQLEILELLGKRKIAGANYVWKSGLSGWSRIQDRPEFAGYFNSKSL